MRIRRIVTGNDQAGKSVFLSDAFAPRSFASTHTPGFASALVWETRPHAAVSDTVDTSLSTNSWVPLAGGTKLIFVTFPPDAVMTNPGFDPVAAGAEYMKFVPGLAEKFEIDNPGMHTTDTIDYGILLDGEVNLEVDNGATKKILPGDVVIQNGTRHAWRNNSGKPATIVFVLIGATRG